MELPLRLDNSRDVEAERSAQENVFRDRGFTLRPTGS